MEEFIKGIAAVRTADGSVAVKWVWPSGYTCVRVVFVHRLGGRDAAELSPGELAECSDLCFTDEFTVAGGSYVFPIGAKDAGLLKFRVYCCDSPDSTDFSKSSGTAQITGITLNIGYKTSEKKSGKLHKKITIALKSDAQVPPGALAYRITPGGAEYVIHRRIEAGSSELGPIIAGAQDSVTLTLAPGHEDEYVIKTM